MWAAYKGHDESVKTLIKAGSNVHAKDKVRFEENVGEGQGREGGGLEGKGRRGGEGEG